MCPWEARNKYGNGRIGTEQCKETDGDVETGVADMDEADQIR